MHFGMGAAAARHNVEIARRAIDEAAADYVVSAEFIRIEGGGQSKDAAVDLQDYACAVQKNNGPIDAGKGENLAEDATSATLMRQSKFSKSASGGETEMVRVWPLLFFHGNAGSPYTSIGVI